MQSTIYLKRMGPIANILIVLSQVVFWKKCDSENMARNVAAQFPPDLELQFTQAF